MLLPGRALGRLAEAWMALIQTNTRYPESSFDDLCSGRRRDVNSPQILLLWLYDVLIISRCFFLIIVALSKVRVSLHSLNTQWTWGNNLKRVGK